MGRPTLVAWRQPCRRSCPRKEFSLWMGNQWHADSSDVLWQVEETLSLTNEHGQAQLQDPCSSVPTAWPQCDVGQGRSMELSFNNAVPEDPCWRTCPESKGMTPGQASQWSQEQKGSQPLPEVSWGVIDNQWAMTVPGGWSWNKWRPHLWEPRTEWQLVWRQGRKMALAPYGPDSVGFRSLPPIWLHPTTPAEALTHLCGMRCSPNLWMAMARFLNCRQG